MLAPLSPENQPALILKYAREAVALAGTRRYADLETDRISVFSTRVGIS